MSSDYTPPRFEEDGFHCPFCGVYAHQNWYNVTVEGGFNDEEGPQETLSISSCENCDRFSLWIDGDIVYPRSVNIPLPLEEMPPEIKADFLEARTIVEDSPRAAAALLRLALQNLISLMGETDDILVNLENLKKRGLDAKIQTALQGVRMVGEGKVEPGKIDPEDDMETASVLFNLLNLIVDALIAQPRRVDEILDKFPEPEGD
ncbi:MAG: DUF4145 domain-containing protein [Candidatus Bathyarchaeota archaeon]